MTGPDTREQLIETAKVWYLQSIKTLGRHLSETEIDVLWSSVQRAGGVPECRIMPED